MNILRFAAIDVGSNAIRLLISNVVETNPPEFIKASIIRLPVRLGDDTFVNQWISDEKIRQLILSFKSFKNIMQVYKVINYKACATSAMREAKNSAEVVSRLKEETGIYTEIISGRKEAEIIYLNHITSISGQTKPYLYVDVGGGSTEIILFSGNEIKLSESFNIGTVRMLNKSIPEGEIDRLTGWSKRYSELYHETEIIASGGNINRIFKLSGLKESKPLTISQLNNFYKILQNMSYEERILNYRLNPDRADVIVYAAFIFLNVMKHAKIHKLYVPKVGLSDGIIRQLYSEYMDNQSL